MAGIMKGRVSALYRRKSLPWQYQFHSVVSSPEAIGADKLREHNWQGEEP